MAMLIRNARIVCCMPIFMAMFLYLAVPAIIRSVPEWIEIFQSYRQGKLAKESINERRDTTWSLDSTKERE